jgi:hypothetical protein
VAGAGINPGERGLNLIEVFAELDLADEPQAHGNIHLRKNCLPRLHGWLRIVFGIVAGIPFVLDARGECGCMASMNMKIAATLLGLGLTILATGCVSTVSGDTKAGMPFFKDKIEASYERPMETVFLAAKEVIKANGAVFRETTLQNQTNTVTGIAKVVEGKVNQCTVWVRTAQVDRKITAVTVQTRTSGGGSDINLAAEIDKQIALRLVR